MDSHYQIKPYDVVVDVGCGPGNFADKLEYPCRLYGFDPSEKYIATAKSRGRGDYFVGGMKEFLAEYGSQLEGQVDVVVSNGVLHHVSPEQIDEILAGAMTLLRPGGRFVALEPVWLEKQDWRSRFVVGLDRGQSIFMDHQWAAIMRRHCPSTEVKVLNSLLRIPYTHVLLTGIR